MNLFEGEKNVVYKRENLHASGKRRKSIEARELESMTQAKLPHMKLCIHRGS